MRYKRADVEVQFNWIFVIVVGVIILSFFIFIVNKQKQVSDTRLASDLLSGMDVVIIGQGVSPGSSKSLEMANLEVRFTCEDYSIMNVPKTTGNSIIFSPSMLKGEIMLAFTNSWDMPFRAANFIYLTSPSVKYYLIGGEIAERIAGEFLESIDMETIDTGPGYTDGQLPSGIGDYERVRVVYFSLPPYDPPSLPDSLKGFDDEKVSVLYIDADEMGDLKGDAKLYFYKKKGNALVKDGDGVSDAFGKSAVQAAIITDSYELYSCNMMKAMKRLDITSRIYGQRMIMLANSLAGESCGGYYSTGSIDGMIDSIRLDDLAGLKDLQDINAETLFSYSAEISGMNDMTELESCPGIY